MTHKEWDRLNPHDKKEIINLIDFKKRLKKHLTDKKKSSIINSIKER